MRLIDLNDIDNNVEQSDICIIGAGALGLFLAECLSKSNLKIILIDAGGKSTSDSKNIGALCKFTKKEYSGATIGRFFGIGGSTSNWGGRLVPFLKSDKYYRDGDIESETWPFIIDVVQKYQHKVFHTLGLKKVDFYNNIKSIFNLNFNSKKINLISGVFLPFRKKNFSFLMRGWKAERFTIYYNATVSDYGIKKLNKGISKVDSIVATSKKGGSITISSDKFIIAAGSIESTRILLEMEDSVPYALFDKRSALGYYLSDHLSWNAGEIKGECVKNIVNIFSHRFKNGLMRSIHFAQNNQSNTLSRYYAHFIFKNEGKGFVLLRDILYSIQQRKFPKIKVTDLALGIIGIVKILFYRFFKATLYIPNNSKVYMQIDVEQYPDKSNQISLIDSLDSFGRKMVEINWTIHKNDYENIRLILNNFQNVESALNIKSCIDNNSIEKANPYDIFHPVGTCRMGLDRTSVVDHNLKVMKFEDLYVLSTAILPTAGSANPTFPLLCFAKKLSEEILNE
jgi:hypothetical protein